MTSEHVRYLFSSVYRFSPEGAKNIEESFESTSEGKEAICRYDASFNQFTIWCSRDHGDATFFAFLSTLKDYIKVEETREKDISEMVMRVERIPETILNETEGILDDWIDISEGSPHGLTEQTLNETYGDLVSAQLEGRGGKEESNGENKRPAEATPHNEHVDELIGDLLSKTVTRMWKPSHWSESILGSEMMGKISKLTRCGTQLDMQNGEVVVTGESDEAVQRAISKLVAVIDASHRNDRGPLGFDFHITEKDVDTRLQFIALRKDTRRLRTTLLSPGSPHIEVLPDLLVLVLLKRDCSYKTFAVPDQKYKCLQSPNKHCRIWAPEYEYKPRGHESLRLTNSTLASTSISSEKSIIHEHLPQSKAALVEKWREGITAPVAHGSPSGAGDAQLDSARKCPSAIENFNGFVTRSTPPKRTYGLKRVPKGMPVPEKTEQYIHPSAQPTAAVPNENAPLDKTTDDYRGVLQSAPDPAVNKSQQDLFNVGEANRVSFDHGVSSMNRLLGTPRFSRTPEANNNYNALIGTWPIASATLAHESITPANTPVLGPSPQLPTRSPRTSIRESGSVQDKPLNSSWKTRVVHSEPTGNLVDFSDATQRPSNIRSGTPAQGWNPTRRSEIWRPAPQRVENTRSGNATNERLQPVSEIESRTAKRTMNQQKDAPGEDAAKGDAAVLKRLEAAAIDTLELARSHNGIVALEVDIGRVLVRSRDVSQDHRKGLFTADEWTSVFPSGQQSGFRDTIFTNMLTTSWVDAEFILDLKFSSGRRMFDKTPHKARVVYDFVCSSRLSKDGSEITVEVQDDGKYQVRSRSKVLGAMNWHFPKRMWDARLALTTATLITDDSFEAAAVGMVDDLSLDGRLVKAAKAIVENLYVPPGGKTLDLYTKTVNKDKTPNKDLIIESVILRRESCHRSTANVHLNLRLTEVQDLVVQRSADTKYLIRAISRAPEVMVKDDRLWWQASLSSDEAEATFKENIHLEIGEQVVWIPEDLVDGGVVRNLSDLAKEVVTRIDNVGYGNKGPRGTSVQQGTVAPSTAGTGTQMNFW